jgi:hypothetical protein
VLGYANEFVDLAMGVFNGDVNKTEGDDVIDGFAASAVFNADSPFYDSEMVFGASYTSSILEAGGLEDEFSVIEDYAAGLSAFISARHEKIILEAEYVSALDKFRPDELLAAKESKPVAYNLELAYLLNDKLKIAGRYGCSEDLGELFPEEQYGLLASYQLFDDTAIAVEYLHGEYENSDVISLVTIQFAVGF